MQRLSLSRLAAMALHQGQLGGLPSLSARGVHSALVTLQQGAAGSGDPFTQQLQQKTERELADLLAAVQARKEGAAGAAPPAASDAEENDLPAVRPGERSRWSRGDPSSR